MVPRRIKSSNEAISWLYFLIIRTGLRVKGGKIALSLLPSFNLVFKRLEFNSMFKGSISFLIVLTICSSLINEILFSLIYPVSVSM